MKNFTHHVARYSLRGALCALLFAGSAAGKPLGASRLVTDKYGAVVRGDVNEKALALVFTGDEYGESFVPILDSLKQRQLVFAYANDAAWLHDSRSFACDGRSAQQILAAAARGDETHGSASTRATASS